MAGTPSPTLQIERAHASAAGLLCADDGTGCCATCGVCLDTCEECGGIGYHTADCQDIELPANNDGAPHSPIKD